MLGKVRYFFFGGGGGPGLQRRGSSLTFWSIGGGSRVLNLWKLGEGHAFRYRKHKLYNISNTFSAIQGAQISKFPGGACPRTPIASECFHVHINPISFNQTCVPHSIHHMHIHSTVNSRRIFPNLDRILWERVGRWHLISATAFSFRIEIDRGALLDKKYECMFVWRVAGTTFEDSFMTYTKWNSAFRHVLWQCVTIRKQPVRSDQ